MSTCKSSNCHLKNFNGCVSNDICEVSGISGTERQAICQPKNNVPDSFYRTDQECENVVSPYSQNPQYDCEEKVGCEWGYSRTITNKILQKKCIPTTVNYSCSSVVRDWSITDLSRYSSQEKETHGCPSDKCDYTPNQKIRNPGSCSGTTASACEDLTKNECIINQECSWSSNDESYCGYRREFEIGMGTFTGGSHRHDLSIEGIEWNGDVVNPIENFCMNIDNPSEEVCSNLGCIWDINGERGNINKYDLFTSGICRPTLNEYCMDNYCSRNTYPISSGNRRELQPNGICKSSHNHKYCQPTDREIIPYKTPGLMDIVGHTDEESEKISSLKHIINTYEYIIKNNQLSTVEDTRRVYKREVEKLYKDTCEKRGLYPSISDLHGFHQNKYNPSTQECSTGGGIHELCRNVRNNYSSIHYPESVSYDEGCIYTGSLEGVASNTGGCEDFIPDVCEGADNCEWYNPEERCKSRNTGANDDATTTLLEKNLHCRKIYYIQYVYIKNKIRDILSSIGDDSIKLSLIRIFAESMVDDTTSTSTVDEHNRHLIPSQMVEPTIRSMWELASTVTPPQIELIRSTINRIFHTYSDNEEEMLNVLVHYYMEITTLEKKGTDPTDPVETCLYNKDQRIYHHHLPDDGLPDLEVIKSNLEGASVINTADVSLSNNYNTYLENSSIYSIQHQIKKIVYAPGKAKVVLRLYNTVTEGNDNVVKLEDHIVDNLTNTLQSRGGEIGFASISGSEQTQSLLLIGSSLKYKITKPPEMFFNDYIEIEIDNVDPGDIDSYNYDTPELKVEGLTMNNQDQELRVEEIYFHDIEMDIYFESDINNLYMKNDIVSIESIHGGQYGSTLYSDEFRNNFNPSFTLDSGPSPGPLYSNITEVDYLEKRIRINHVLRINSGIYFPGSFSKNIDSTPDVKKCIKVDWSSDATSTATPTRTVTDVEDNSCHYDINSWYHCMRNLQTCEQYPNKCTRKQVAGRDSCIPEWAEPGEDNVQTYLSMYPSSDDESCSEYAKGSQDISHNLLELSKCNPIFDNDDGNRLFKQYYGTMFNEGLIDNFKMNNDPSGSGYHYKIDLGGFNILPEYFNKINYNNEVTFNDWVIEFINNNETPEKEIGIIKEFTPLGHRIFVFKIMVNGVYNRGTIHVLNIYPSVKGISLSNPRLLIQNYIRKEINTEINNDRYFPKINNMKTCEYNNGIWEEFICKTHGRNIDSNVRNIDICENSGFQWNTNSQVCSKESRPGSNAIYCSNKSLTTGQEPPIDPCPSCNFVDNICEAKSRNYCLNLSKQECIEDNVCEYHNDLMESPIYGIKPHAMYYCIPKESAPDDSTCSVYSRKLECDSNGCEWQCPLIGAQEGYIVKLDTDRTDPVITEDSSTINYYSPTDLNVVCDTSSGWRPIHTYTDTRVSCIPNTDRTSLELGHRYRIDVTGCRPQIYCGGNRIGSNTLTEGLLRTLSIQNTPSEFVVEEDGQMSLNINKLPDEVGSYRCPEPKSLVQNANSIIGWSDDMCCYNTGLCEGNTTTNEDIQCPIGKVTEKIYYSNSDELQSLKGSTIEVCCVTPEEPIITLRFSGDYGDIIGEWWDIGEESQFKENFKTDIISILNSSENDITITILPHMIEIINIEEGSIIITFKIKKDPNHNIIIGDQIIRAIPIGTVLESLNIITTDVPSINQYDPLDKYLYYFESIEWGFTTRELIIFIVVLALIILVSLITLGSKSNIDQTK